MQMYASKLIDFNKFLLIIFSAEKLKLLPCMAECLNFYLVFADFSNCEKIKKKVRPGIENQDVLLLDEN